MILFVLGTRPEMVKLRPVMAALPRGAWRSIWTGQHWSESLGAAVARDLRWEPDLRLRVDLEGIAGRGRRLQAMAAALAPILRSEAGTGRSWVVVQGDTDSCLAGAIAGRQAGLRVYHVEAGCRSGNLAQPEELNRIAADHLAHAASASYLCDRLNLEREGRVAVPWYGDTLVDWIRSQPEPRPAGAARIVATIHRAETLGDPEALRGVVQFLERLGRDCRLVLFAHPHLRRRMAELGLPERAGAFEIYDPVPPSQFSRFLASAPLVVTDSGGVATEAAFRQVPCLVCREETELRDLVACGLLQVGGTRPETLEAALGRMVPAAPSQDVLHAWRPGAGERIAHALLRLDGQMVEGARQ